MKKIRLLIILAFALNGCAFGSDPTSGQKDQIKQNNVIEKTYQPLIGTYAGLLQTAQQSFEVQLVIYLASQSVTNPDGTPGVKRIPSASMTLMTTGKNYLFTVRGYSAEVGQLSLVNNTSATVDDINSLELQVLGQNLAGKALTPAGTLGDLNLQFKSPNTFIPGPGTGEDRREKLLAQYKAIQGDYEGFVAKGKEKTPISIQLTAFSTADGDPSLAGYYKRLDAPGVIDLALTVKYNPETNPPRITLNGNGGGSYIISIEGTISGDELSGEMNSVRQGYLGKVQLNKK